MADLKIMEILSPGILTSIQDLGRYGYGRYGVAPSGALDPFSLRIANLLVGNRPDQAGLETMLLGPAIRVLADIVVAVTGGNLQPLLNKQRIEMWRSHNLKKDDILSFGSMASGLRAYVAVGGGIRITPVMGSRSTTIRIFCCRHKNLILFTRKIPTYIYSHEKVLSVRALELEKNR